MTLGDWAWMIGGWTLAGVGAAAAARALWWDRSRGRRRCPRCWYDMGGVVGLVCPECGTRAHADRSLRRTRRRLGRAVLGGGCVLAGALLVRVPSANRDGWTVLVPDSIWRALLPFVDPVPEKIDASWLNEMMWVNNNPRAANVRSWDRLLLAHRCRSTMEAARQYGFDEEGGSPHAPPALVVHSALLRAAVVRPQGELALPAVESLLWDERSNEMIRSGCHAGILYLAPPRRAVRVLRRVLLEDPSPKVRWHAIETLWRLPPETVGRRAALEIATRDADQTVKTRAEQLLESLKSEGSGAER